MRIMKWQAFVLSLLLLAAACSKPEAGDGNKSAADSTAMADSAGTKGVAEKSGKDDNSQADELKAVPVEVTTITPGEISSFILTTSSIETEEAVDIFPQVSGIVVKLRAEEGDHVKKGDVLLEIDDREYSLKEQAASVNYERQKNSFARSKSMFEKSLLSADEFEVAKFNLAQARIEWEQAKLTLDYCKIKAPITGVISERTCKLGDRLLTSSKVYSMVNNDLLLAKVYLTEKDALRTKVGQQVIIMSEALPEQKFAGRVERISPVVDPSSGMVRVTTRVFDPQGLLKPGMFVNAHLITDLKKNAVLVPKKAIVYDDNLQFIYVVRNDSLARKVPLKIGYTNRHNVEALEGVDIGDTIIVVGQSGMKDSTRVQIAEFKI